MIPAFSAGMAVVATDGRYGLEPGRMYEVSCSIVEELVSGIPVETTYVVDPLDPGASFRVRHPHRCLEPLR